MVAREVEPVAVSWSVCPFAEFVSCAGGAMRGAMRGRRNLMSLQSLDNRCHPSFQSCPIAIPSVSDPAAKRQGRQLVHVVPVFPAARKARFARQGPFPRWQPLARLHALDNRDALNYLWAGRQGGVGERRVGAALGLQPRGDPGVRSPRSVARPQDGPGSSAGAHAAGRDVAAVQCAPGVLRPLGAALRTHATRRPAPRLRRLATPLPPHV